MELKILSKQFLSNYIFHPSAKELSLKDQRKALISSLFLGIFTLGICHLVCLIKYRNRTFKLAATDDPVAKKAQTVRKTTQKTPKEKRTAPGSTAKPAAKKAPDPVREELDALTKIAKKEDDAFLIDFSKITPSNIFKIFLKEDHYGKAYGDTWISDEMSEDPKFTHNFPFKYKINTITQEKNEHGLPSYYSCMFTMNAEGKVEWYGTVFDSFNAFIEYRMTTLEGREGKFVFKHFDFHSVWTDKGYEKLRKKSPVVK